MFVPYTPECLQEEVFNQYGVIVPLEDIYAYLDADQFLTPESLYLMVMEYGE